RPRRPSFPGLRYPVSWRPLGAAGGPGLRRCGSPPPPRPPPLQSLRCVEASGVWGRERGGGEGSGVTRRLLPPPPPSGASFLQRGRPVTPALLQAGRGRAADRPGRRWGEDAFSFPRCWPLGTAALWRMRVRWLLIIVTKLFLWTLVMRQWSSVTMSDRKAVIKNADMSEDMQQDAVDCATQAMEKYNIEKDIAAYIKKEFDKKYNPTWHCIVGRNFGSYVTHETKHFIYFYLGQVAILLFKSG
uniref:Dynein light chain n=5 Tax=Boreoeutheria TaxID=1437010 RepID=A0ABI7ZLH7_FELCA